VLAQLVLLDPLDQQVQLALLVRIQLFKDLQVQLALKAFKVFKAQQAQQAQQDRKAFKV
jgi:hypothetical protein